MYLNCMRGKRTKTAKVGKIEMRKIRISVPTYNFEFILHSFQSKKNKDILTLSFSMIKHYKTDSQQLIQRNQKVSIIPCESKKVSFFGWV